MDTLEVSPVAINTTMGMPEAPPLYLFPPDFEPGHTRDLENSEYDIGQSTRTINRARRLSCPVDLREVSLPPLQPLPAEDPVFESTVAVDNITSWPQILGYLRQWFAARHLGLPKSAVKIPSVCCNICSTELAIEGLQPARFGLEEEELEGQEGVLTPCGHVLGASCMESWANTSVRLGGEITCPVCRCDLSEGPQHRCERHETWSGGAVLELGDDTEKFGFLSNPVKLDTPQILQEVANCPDCTAATQAAQDDEDDAFEPPN